MTCHNYFAHLRTRPEVGYGWLIRRGRQEEISNGPPLSSWKKTPCFAQERVPVPWANVEHNRGGEQGRIARHHEVVNSTSGLNLRSRLTGVLVIITISYNYCALNRIARGICKLVSIIRKLDINISSYLILRCIQKSATRLNWQCKSGWSGASGEPSWTWELVW